MVRRNIKEWAQRITEGTNLPPKVLEESVCRILNKVYKECEERLLKSAEEWRAFDKKVFPMAVIRAEECEAQASNFRAIMLNFTATQSAMRGAARTREE